MLPTAEHARLAAVFARTRPVVCRERCTSLRHERDTGEITMLQPASKSDQESLELPFRCVSVG